MGCPEPLELQQERNGQVAAELRAPQVWPEQNWVIFVLKALSTQHSGHWENGPWPIVWSH